MTDAEAHDALGEQSGAYTLPDRTVHESQLNEKQRSAVALCCNTDNDHRIVAVAGPAGTGKTSIIRQVHERYVNQGYDVAVAAPTGKAARRIREATGIQAQTVHKLLQFTTPGETDPDTGEVYEESVPQRNKSNPLREQIVLIDEYSMIGPLLHRQIIDAMPDGGLLRAFGDDKQLRPVDERAPAREAPSRRTPFERLLYKFPSVLLDHNYRVAAGNSVASAAERIRKGWMVSGSDDVELIFTNNHRSMLAKQVRKERDEGVDYASLSNQIIAPLNKKDIGTLSLNPMVREIVFGGGSDQFLELERHPSVRKEGVYSIIVEPGEKVIFTQNMYDLRPAESRYDENGQYISPSPYEIIMNGEVGIVSDVSTEDGHVWIALEDRTVCIPPLLEYTDKKGRQQVFDPRIYIDYAYVLTVHKAMGSEFDRTIFIMAKQVFYMLSRRMFYTAFTRTRSHIKVICDQKALQTAISYLDNKLTRDEWQKRGVRQ